MFHLCRVLHSICNIFSGTTMAERDGCDFSQHLPMFMVGQRFFWLLGGAKIAHNPYIMEMLLESDF